MHVFQMINQIISQNFVYSNVSNIKELQFSNEDKKKSYSCDLTTDTSTSSKSDSNTSSTINVNNISPLPSSSSTSSVITISTTSTNTRIKNQNVLNNSTTFGSRNRRQDWCKWPICIQYRTTGYCLGYNPNGTLPASSQMCQAAHIGPNDQVPLSSDGQLTCNRSDCYFYHPPKLIRDKIVAKRHAQYLREKVIRDASKSRKLNGLLTFEQNINAGNNITRISQNKLTTPNKSCNQSVVPQELIRITDIHSSSSVINRDNLHNFLHDCHADSIQLTNPTHHLLQQHSLPSSSLPLHQSSQLNQQTNFNPFIQCGTTNQSNSHLIPNSISSYLSNILLSNLLYIPPSSINSSLFLPNPRPVLTNTTKSQFPDINLFCTPNQIDYEKLCNLILLNSTPLTQPIYSSNLTTSWSKLLDTLIMNNPSLFLANIPQNTTIPINSHANCLTSQFVDSILPFNYLLNVPYSSTTNEINNTLPTALFPLNQGIELLPHVGMTNTVESQSNISSISYSSAISQSYVMSSPPSSSLLLSNTPINPEILLQNSQFLIPTDHTLNVNLNTTTTKSTVITTSIGSPTSLSTTTTTTTTNNVSIINST
ncbi:unnamed protein product [Schistosoma curassoni]|nr:unnamed protein product [Schistosoma curassoni]